MPSQTKTTIAPTSTSCVPTSTPTSLVILTVEKSTRAQYDAFIDTLKKNGVAITDQVIYDAVNFRALAADIDDCTVKLLDDPIISTISAKANGFIDEDVTDSSASTTAKRTPRSARRHKKSRSASKRDVDPATILETELEYHDGFNIVYNNHLNWLSSPWAKMNLAGNCEWFYKIIAYDTSLSQTTNSLPDLDFQTYLWGSVKPASDAKVVSIFVLDTGANTAHEVSSHLNSTYVCCRMADRMF